MVVTARGRFYTLLCVTLALLCISGVLLAVLVVVFGVIAAFDSSVGTRPGPMGLTREQSVVIPLTTITLFAAFVTTALLLRQRPALHKRFMVLGMISVLSPPIARLVRLAEFEDYFLAIQIMVPALFIGWCLSNDWRTQRIVHPIYAIGGMFLVLSWPLRVLLGQAISSSPFAKPTLWRTHASCWLPESSLRCGHALRCAGR
jgi:hypothetical protein